MTTTTFESWGIVEIMGHVRLAGKITEQVIAGAAMLRVDVPRSPIREPFTKFYGSSAIYSITPTDEETAMKAVVAFEVAPIQEYILRINSPQLTEKLQSARDRIFHGVEGDYYPDDDDDEEDDDWGFHDDGHDDDDDEIPAPETPALKSIVSMERGETASSKSPMWRCVTIDGERVNVFKHADPKKDTFHLFDKAGYGTVMEAMKVGDVLTWKAFPIGVNMEKKGDWWEVRWVYQSLPTDKPDIPPKAEAAAWAKELVDSDQFVVLDMETTGLDESVDEPVQIGVVAADGSVIFTGLVKPSVPVHPEALAVHGITADMLKEAPPFADIRDKLRDAIGDKRVIVYNANFDKNILRNANGDGQWEFGDIWECAMEQYAAFWGERFTWRSGYKPQSLREALKQQGVEFVGTLHSAVGDCQATLELIKKMAAYEEPKTVEHPF